ncbi:MAG: ROK family protein [Janthinobacterium lividum]
MAKTKPASPTILAIDIGGTGLKAALIDAQGSLIGERLRVPTPYPCPPEVLIATLVTLCHALGGYGRIAIGFPGVVRDGRVLTAPHFKDEHWSGYPLEAALSQALGNLPARLVNDAQMQGLAAIQGKGLELVLTLGTGAGTALFLDGQPTPHLELAHHPIRGRKSYNDYIGDLARQKIGRKRWNRRVLRTIGILESLLHYDHLYIGGGNAARIDIPLPPEVSTVSNDAGLKGGAALWQLGESASTD